MFQGLATSRLFKLRWDNRQRAIYLGVGNAAQGSEIQIKKPLAHTVLQKQAPNMGEQVLLGALHFK